MKKSLRLKALPTLLVGLFLSIGAFAQQIAVKGHVKDTTGEPVIGANVLVKGTTNGTITDFDGNFMLKVRFHVSSFKEEASVFHWKYPSK